MSFMKKYFMWILIITIVISGCSVDVPIDFNVTQAQECKINSDCISVDDITGGCCMDIISINKNYAQEYREVFFSEIRSHENECDKEFRRGLSCASIEWDHFCINTTCQIVVTGPY